MKRCITLFTSILFIVGCSSSSKSEYHYEANANDPTLEFTADFNGKKIPPIHFKLNVDNTDNNKCSDFHEIGYYYPESSIFILAKANPELNAKVPANKPVAIRGHYNVAGESSCYAKIKEFTPEAGKTYVVNYKLNRRKCNIEIVDKQTSQPVKYKLKKQCSKR